MEKWSDLLSSALVSVSVAAADNEGGSADRGDAPLLQQEERHQCNHSTVMHAFKQCCTFLKKLFLAQKK